MTVDDLIDRLASGTRVEFEETIATIEQNYRYQPVTFTNGFGAEKIINAAGTNEGSCKIFAFACLHELTQDSTLALFGNFYWVDVLGNPGGSNHKNIRNFMKFGWDHIEMEGQALTPLHELGFLTAERWM